MKENRKILRLREVRKRLNITQDEIVSLTGIPKRSYLNYEQEKTAISIDKLQKVATCLNVKLTDLLEDDPSDKLDLVNEEPVVYNKTHKRIPLVDAYAIGGFGGSDFSIQANDVKYSYVIPKFENKRVDFMIEVNGSSMYPKYNSGDVVACRVIRDSKIIQWNKTYVVATEENGILIKRLRKGTEPDSLLAISDNLDYDPFNIPKEEITSLAIVVGVIRLE